MLPDEKYKNLMSKLSSLPKIKARSDFNQRLFAKIQRLEKINSHLERRIEPVYLSKFKELIYFIFKPSFAPAYALTSLLLLIVVVYAVFLTGNKVSDQFVYESTPVSQQSEFVIYKHQKQEISDISLQDGLTSPESELSADTKFDKHLSDFGTDRKSRDIRDGIQPEEPYIERLKTDNNDLKTKSQEKLDESELAPSNIRKTETENVEKKEENVMRKKSDKMTKDSSEDKTIKRGEINQSTIKDEKLSVKDSIGVKGQKLQDEPDTNRR